jgi:hypothetical protein
MPYNAWVQSPVSAIPRSSGTHYCPLSEHTPKMDLPAVCELSQMSTCKKSSPKMISNSHLVSWSTTVVQKPNDKTISRFTIFE